MKVSHKDIESLKQEVQEQSHLYPGVSIPLFNGYINPIKILDSDSTSFIRERAETILTNKKANFVILRNTRDNDADSKDNTEVDFINFPILEVIDQVRVLIEEGFGGKVISEYVLLAKLARLDRHKDYTDAYFKDETKPNHYKVPIGVSIFLGPDGGAPLAVYTDSKTMLQGEPGTMAIFGPTIEHDHPKGHNSYYLVYQPTLEFEIDCGC
jgi:hypothetical protein